MERQEAFDKAVGFILKQGKKSFRDTGRGQGCAYRGNDNCRCPIGILIPDNLYDAALEGLDLPSMLETHIQVLSARAQGLTIRTSAYKVFALIEFLGLDDLGFLYDLQYVHDWHVIDDWEADYRRVADHYGLAWNL
jgi:hypothetical protein